MYNSTSELIKNELSNNVLQPVYNIFEDSIKVYRELMEHEEELFKGLYISEFKSRLINYIIKRSFDMDRIPKNFPFKVSAVDMACGQKRTELKRNNILLTLGKSRDPHALPSVSRYKREFSKGNSTINKQLKMDFDSNENKFSDIPYYGIITYNIKDTKLEFLNIVIPDSTYNQVLDSLPVTPNLKLLKNDLIEDVNKEEKLVNEDNIKKEVRDMIIKLKQETR